MTERDYSAERSAALASILADTSQLKLIVAGAGTGKTFSFSQALTQEPHRNQVITFIRLLVGDMKPVLAAQAQVQTFHAYAVGVLHKIGAPGLTNNFKVYPLLARLLQLEVRILGGAEVDAAELERAMQWLEHSAQIDALLKAADYYDAVSFVDVVYRLYERLSHEPKLAPEHDLLVVDEVQDFTNLEIELICLLGKSSHVLAAGDDDQAIYSRRHASPQFIRDMARGGNWKTFELPFCSRCTPVVVEAVHDVVGAAQAKGLLKDRLDKTYECYVPEKAEDDRLYPRIKVVECSVDRPKAHMPARYVADAISKIRQEDIVASYEGPGYPTVLIIGPGNFTDPIIEVLERDGYAVNRRPEDRTDIDILDGYLMLRDGHYSRLGWRIVLECQPPPKLENLLRDAVEDGKELRDLLDGEYVDEHLAIVALLGRLGNGEELAPEEIQKVERSTSHSIDEIKKAIDPPKPEQVVIDESRPRILVTSFVGAKGLSGGHVFVVGMSVGFLPRKDAVTDEDVRLFIVALTRTRQGCHLLWVKRYGKPRGSKPPPLLQPSPLLEWIAAERVERVIADADYFKRTSAVAVSAR